MQILVEYFELSSGDYLCSALTTGSTPGKDQFVYLDIDGGVPVQYKVKRVDMFIHKKTPIVDPGTGDVGNGEVSSYSFKVYMTAQ